METEMRSGTLNFAITGFVAASMDLSTIIFAEKPASRSIYLQIFKFIQALLKASRSIN
jgi:hypothetical protein